MSEPSQTRQRLVAALAKPLPEGDFVGDVEDFDPWRDIISGVDGHYSSESDELMIEVLEAVKDGTTFELIERRGFAAEFALYVLSGHDLVDYGTSPRAAWPDFDIADLWQLMIDKWRAYSDVAWGAAGSEGP